MCHRDSLREIFNFNFSCSRHRPIHERTEEIGLGEIFELTGETIVDRLEELTGPTHRLVYAAKGTGKLHHWNPISDTIYKIFVFERNILVFNIHCLGKNIEI